MADYIERMIDFVYKLIKDSITNTIPELEIKDDCSFTLPDDFVKQSDKVWVRLGLLEELKEPDRSIVSYNYTMMAVYLLSNEELTNVTYGGMPLDTMIFPIIRRSSYSERITNPKLFWDFCGEWFRKHADWIDSMKRRGVRIDAEAQAACVLSETIERIIKQENNGENN